MKYYRVKPQFDNHYYNPFKASGFLVAYELYTEKELAKLETHGAILTSKMFEVVEIPKSKIYWFFGARFEMKVD